MQKLYSATNIRKSSDIVANLTENNDTQQLLLTYAL